MILRDSPYRGDADYDRVIAWATPAIGPDRGKHRAEFVRLVDKAKTAGEPKAEKE